MVPKKVVSAVVGGPHPGVARAGAPPGVSTASLDIVLGQSRNAAGCDAKLDGAFPVPLSWEKLL